MSDQKIQLAYPEPQYEDRIMTLARGLVFPGCSPQMIKRKIAWHRHHEGDAVADDLRYVCQVMWKWQSQRHPNEF